MRAAGLLVLALVPVVAGCASRARVLPPPDLSAGLAEADAQLHAGCFDCLRDSLAKYQALRVVTGALAAATQRATVGAFRAAALLALRQRELGMVNDGYLSTARQIRASWSCEAVLDCASSDRILEAIELMPTGAPGESARPPATDLDFSFRQRTSRSRQEWSAAFRAEAAQDPLAAYVWLGYACGPFGDSRRDEALAAIGPLRDLPLLRFKEALCYLRQDGLQAVVAAEPRYREVSYLSGVAAVAGIKLDEAAEAFGEAYAWHSQWPAVTLAMGNVQLTSEEFERALDFYDRTLQLEPLVIDAMLGRVRALTYLGRYEHAVTASDQLLAGRWYLGEARYWRALNEVSLGRLDEAWADVEEAAKLLVNAEVPKLAGIIAYRRKELDVARAKFDLSRGRNQSDCETGFYLGVVLAEQRNWVRTADVFIATASCLRTAAVEAAQEIERIRMSDAPPERRQRQIARRERQIAEGERMTATSAFNTAVAYYNLSRGEDARPFAETVRDDPQFGDRARDLLSRLK